MNRILIVDDDAFVGRVYRGKFGIEGFSVELAQDGEAALVAVANFNPELIILDLMLPKLSGVEVLRRLRADPRYHALPIIVQTNSYMSHVMEEAWKAGATKCVSKADASPKVMVEMVRELLRQKALETTTLAARGAATMEAGARAGFSIEDDRQFRLQLAEDFARSAPGMLAGIQELSQQLARAGDETARGVVLGEMYRKARALAGAATMAEIHQVARLGSAFEVLVGELRDKPPSVTPSAIRTCAQTIDFLAKLLRQVRPGEPEHRFNPLILVVDDEPLSRRAIVRAVAKGQMLSVNVDQSEIALQLLKDNAFDLATLDIEMPGMNGLELCKKMRTLDNHKETPVIFVTNQGDFQARAQSALSGGNDFIAKPFLFIELTLKIMMQILRRQLAQSSPQPVTRQS